MTIPTTFTGILFAVLANSRLVRKPRPRHQNKEAPNEAPEIETAAPAGTGTAAKSDFHWQHNVAERAQHDKPSQ